MSYSYTLSATQTFTIADAKYLASRIKTDLTLLRQFYGYPSIEKVEQFTLEAGILLKFNMLDWVKYGFRKNGEWIFALEYKANYLGQLQMANDDPGGIPFDLNVSSDMGYSYLVERHNAALTDAERANVQTLLPFQRGGAPEPGSTGGITSPDRSYYRNGLGLSRNSYRRY